MACANVNENGGKAQSDKSVREVNLGQFLPFRAPLCRPGSTQQHNWHSAHTVLVSIALFLSLKLSLASSCCSKQH